MSDDFDQSSMDSLKELMGDDVHNLVERYIVNSQKYILEIGQGIAGEDAERIRGSAHPLKSSSGMMGLTKVMELAAEIEHMAKSGLDDFLEGSGVFVKYQNLQKSAQSGFEILKSKTQ